jgi:MFS family permease
VHQGSDAGRLRGAVTIVFFVNGALFATLFARMPALKAEAGLSDGELGLCIFCGSIALMLSQTLTGAAISRFGSRSVVAVGVTLYGGLLFLPAVAAGIPTFALGMAAVGAGSGILDVSMNTQAALAEAGSERRIFASFHAAFSFGALAGATSAGVVASLGVAPLPHLAAAGALGVVVGIAASRRMLARHDDASAGGPAFARPTKALFALGAIALCALLAEGSVGDWSAVLLADVRGASPGLAAIGLAAFSATMGFGRLAADPLADRFGPANVVRGGALVAMAGLAVVVLPLPPGVAIAGFLLMGSGLAGLFPLALVAAARAPGAAPAASIAAVSTAGYAGLLTGPAVIGGLSEATGLPAALTIIFPLCVTVVLLGRAAGPR